MSQDNSINSVEIRKLYHESGALWREIPYENGKKCGVEKYYHESGALWREIPYENGEKHGIAKTYYESGPLHWVTPYVNGKIHGIKKVYVKDTQEIYRLSLYDKERYVLALYKDLSKTAIKFKRYGNES